MKCHVFLRGIPWSWPMNVSVTVARCQNIFFAIPVTHLIDAAGREGPAVSRDKGCVLMRKASAKSEVY